jgi:signal transduction histidine kinase
VIVDEGGRRLSQGILTDTTDRMEAERQLRGSLEKLRELGQQRQLLLSRLVTAQEEERHRIAGEIHDDPVQHLYAAGLRMGMLQETLEQPDDRAAVEGIQDLLQGTINRLRRMLFELQPHALETGGLAAALTEYVRYANDEGETRYLLDDRSTEEPSMEIQTVAYRAVIESVANVRRHADATNVTISIEDDEGGIRISVTDDGRGFDPDAIDPHRPGHLGLPAMRERVLLAGGSFEVTSAPGRGTTVELVLPTT